MGNEESFTENFSQVESKIIRAMWRSEGRVLDSSGHVICIDRYPSVMNVVETTFVEKLSIAMQFLSFRHVFESIIFFKPAFILTAECASLLRLKGACQLSEKHIKMINERNSASSEIRRSLTIIVIPQYYHGMHSIITETCLFIWPERLERFTNEYLVSDRKEAIALMSYTVFCQFIKSGAGSRFHFHRVFFCGILPKHAFVIKADFVWFILDPQKIPHKPHFLTIDEDDILHKMDRKTVKTGTRQAEKERAGKDDEEIEQDKAEIIEQDKAEKVGEKKNENKNENKRGVRNGKRAIVNENLFKKRKI